MNGYQDVHDHLDQIAALHVTDINTLDALLSSPAPTNTISTAFQRATSLSIFLIFPKSVFVATKSRVRSSNSLGSLFAFNHDEIALARQWLESGPALCVLNSLKKVDVWMDFEGLGEWWNINEEAVLEPLRGLLERGDVELGVSLPSHADDDIPILAWQSNIIRRARQELWPEVDANGQITITTKKQFPLCQSGVSAEVAAFCAQSREELLVMGRAMWKRGQGVGAYLRGMEEELRGSD